MSCHTPPQHRSDIAAELDRACRFLEALHSERLEADIPGDTYDGSPMARAVDTLLARNGYSPEVHP
jgi:hypothetical protein